MFGCRTQVPNVKGKGPLLLLRLMKRILTTMSLLGMKGNCAMQVVGTNPGKEKVLEKEDLRASSRGLASRNSATTSVDLFPDSRIVRPNLRAPVTLPGFPIIAIVTQILFLEIQILVPREILEIGIPVKLDVNSVCFAKYC